MPDYEELNTALPAAGMACRAVGGGQEGVRGVCGCYIAPVYPLPCFVVLILPESLMKARALLTVVVVSRGHGWVKL